MNRLNLKYRPIAIGPADVIIRPLATADVDTATAVIASAFRQADGTLPERYSPTVVKERLQTSLTSERPTRSRFLVMENDGLVIAVGGFSREAWSPIAWSLYLAAVHPDLQGNGLGHRMIEERVAVIERSTTGAGMVLTSARRPHSYEVLGFQALRKMPHGPTLMFKEFTGTKAEE